MLKKIAKASTPALLGAVSGNLAYYLIDSYFDSLQVREGLPDAETVAAAWIPQSTLAAATLAAQSRRHPGALGFVLAMAITLVARAADGRRAPPVTPSTIVSQ